MAGKKNPLDAGEALRRTDRMCRLLRMDIQVALRAQATFAAADVLMWQKDFNRESKFGDTYNVIEKVLRVNVALAIARMFDLSKNHPLEQQEKASVPVLAVLLGRKDLQQRLIARAPKWHPDLEAAKLNEDTCRD